MSRNLDHHQKKQTAQKKVELAFWAKLSIVVLVVTVATAFLVVVAAGAMAQHHNYILSSIILVVGTSSLLTCMFAILQRQHEQRLHRIFTAMAASETARAQAEAAAREKSRLLATMSHEIRTPLNGVIGMLGLLSETTLSLEQKNYADTAHSSGRILLSIIDEILDTAKSQSQTKQTHTELVTLVESVTELLATRAHAKGIDVSAYVSKSVPHSVALDDMHLRQVLFNLVGNAIKFTQKGGVAVEVQMTAANTLQIVVRDSGIGMSPEESTRIFAPFVQANEQTAKRFGGTGLGLSISRKLIQAMQGTISVESKPNIGTAFVVTFPITQIDATKLPEQPLANRHYVLAMSDGFARDHLQKTLIDFGAKTIIVENRKTLFTLLRAPKPTRQFICDTTFSATLASWAKYQHQVFPTAVVWVMMKAEQRKNNMAFLSAPFAGYLLNPLRKSTLLNQLVAFDVKALKQTSQLLRKSKKSNCAKSPQAKSALRILLAEDNAINALLARTILQKLGHSVITVGDGAQALQTLQNDQSFDVVLLDMEMPKLNGIETARAIRLDPKLKHLPLLALTANAHNEDVQACLAAGMNDHLSKPFDKLDLQEKIVRLVKNNKAAKAA